MSKMVRPTSSHRRRVIAVGRRLVGPRLVGRRAFSFAEVMFAVVILGIGFIMVAAIFPVAIQQTRTTMEESMGAAAAREGTNVISQAPSFVPFNPTLTPSLGNTFQTYYQLQQGPPAGYVQQHLAAANYILPLLFPPTTKESNFYNIPAGNVSYRPISPQQFPGSLVAPISAARWNVLRGSLMLPSDDRVAWIPFYRRDSGSNQAQLFLFSVNVRNRSTYERSKDLTPPLKQLQVYNSNGSASGLTTPGNVTASFQRGNWPTIVGGQAPSATNYPPGSPGYPDQVLLSNLPNATPAEGYEGWCIRVQGTGRIYRLGQQVAGSPLTPNTNSKTFVLAEPDDLRVGPGADGIWGTVDDVYDDPAAFTNNTTPVDLLPPATFQPRLCRIRLDFPAGSIAGRVTFYNPTGIGQPLSPNPVPDTPGPITSNNIVNNVWQQPEAAPGAFIIICDDMASDQTASIALGRPYVHYAGAANGRIYRLSAPVQTIDPNTNKEYTAWELAPNVGMKDPAKNVDESLPRQQPNSLAFDPLPRAYIIGAGLINPQDMFNGTSSVIPQTSGAAQETSYFTTYIAVQ